MSFPLSLVLLLAQPPVDLTDSNDIPKRFLGKTILETPLGFKEKVVALTFDDGPDPKVTPRMLDILRREKIKATFFILGVNAREYPKVVKQIAAEKHAIGNHSWIHPKKPPLAQAKMELFRNRTILKELVGIRPKMYRPPYGITRNLLTPMAAKDGDVIIIWTGVANDTATKSPQKVYDNICSYMKPGAILLMHDGYGKTWTADALPKIIATYRKNGYSFVTVPEMLRRYDAFLQKNPKAWRSRAWHY